MNFMPQDGDHCAITEKGPGQWILYRLQFTTGRCQVRNCRSFCQDQFSGEVPLPKNWIAV